MNADDKMNKILLASNHPIISSGLIQIIDQEGDLVVCGEIDNDQIALEMINKLHPKLILLVLLLHSRLGLDLVKRIGEHVPHISLIVISDCDESLYAYRALQSGARGYFTLQTTIVDLIAGIRQVLNGDLAVSQKLAIQLLQTTIKGQATGGHGLLARLSNRELEVLRYIGQGYSVREIAANLCLSAKTIETHRSHLLKKLNMKHTPDLIRFAIHWFNQDYNSAVLG